MSSVWVVVDLDLAKGTAERWLASALPALGKGIAFRDVPDSDLDGDVLSLDAATVKDLLAELQALARLRWKIDEGRFELGGVVSPDELASLLAPLARLLAAAASLGAEGEGACLQSDPGADGTSHHIEVGGGKVAVVGLDPEGDAKRWSRIEKRWPKKVFTALDRRAAKDASTSSTAAPVGLHWIDARGAVVAVAPGKEARGFREGLAAASDRKWKWGYLDETGAWRIPPTFDEAQDFSEGLALVRKKDRWGLIDAGGKEVIPIHHRYATGMSCGRAMVSVDGEEYCFVDRTNTPLKPRWEGMTPFSEDLAAVWVGSGWSYCDLRGAIVLKGPFTHATPFRSGRALVRGKKGWFVIDGRGDVVVAPKPGVDLSDAGEGFSVSKSEKWGMIDRDGAVVAPAELDEVGPLHEGMVAGRRGKEWRYYRAGQAILGPFGFAAPFGGGRAIVADAKGAWSIVDAAGGRVAEIAMRPTSAGRFEANGLAWVGGPAGKLAERKRHGFVDREGRVVVPPRYAAIEDWDRPFILVRP